MGKSSQMIGFSIWSFCISSLQSLNLKNVESNDSEKSIKSNQFYQAHIVKWPFFFHKVNSLTLYSWVKFRVYCFTRIWLFQTVNHYANPSYLLFNYLPSSHFFLCLFNFHLYPYLASEVDITLTKHNVDVLMHKCIYAKY